VNQHFFLFAVQVNRSDRARLILSDRALHRRIARDGGLHHMMHLVIRELHILCGALWFGIAVFGALFLGPAVESLGPDGGKVMQALQKRGFIVFMPVIAVLTLVSGFYLFYVATGGFNPDLARTHAGRSYSIGGGIGLLIAWRGLRTLIAIYPGQPHRRQPWQPRWGCAEQHGTRVDGRGIAGDRSPVRRGPGLPRGRPVVRRRAAHRRTNVGRERCGATAA